MILSDKEEIDTAPSRFPMISYVLLLHDAFLYNKHHLFGQSVIQTLKQNVSYRVGAVDLKRKDTQGFMFTDQNGRVSSQSKLGLNVIAIQLWDIHQWQYLEVWRRLVCIGVSESKASYHVWWVQCHDTSQKMSLLWIVGAYFESQIVENDSSRSIKSDILKERRNVLTHSHRS